MTNKEILQADLLDIVFEHRNKIYGAYALRKDYNHRLGTALGIALSIVLFCLLLSAFWKKDDGNRDNSKNEGVFLTSINLEPEKIEEPEPKKLPEQTQPVARVDHQQIIIVDDDQADPFLPDQDALRNPEISNMNVDGISSDGINKPDDQNGNAHAAVVKDPEPEPEMPSYPPTFPGGESAWLKFLRGFLQAPEDLEPGERKEVKVRFWIDENGYFSKFEIIQSGGSNFDKEVLRVMKKMPKWEPAMQNGRKVAVAFTQPVIFVGAEE